MAFQDDIKLVRTALNRLLGDLRDELGFEPTVTKKVAGEGHQALDRIEKSRELVGVSFTAQPLPVLAGGELMALLKPKVDALCAEAAERGYEQGYAARQAEENGAALTCSAFETGAKGLPVMRGEVGLAPTSALAANGSPRHQTAPNDTSAWAS